MSRSGSSRGPLEDSENEYARRSEADHRLDIERKMPTAVPPTPKGDAMETTEQTFGVFTEVTNAYGEDGYPSITLYTARGESMFGRSLSAYWSLTLEEAERLGASLIEHVGRARQKASDA